MSKRFLNVIAVAAAVMAATALLRLATVRTAGQAPTASASPGTATKTTPAALKTAWGEPDLQGIWNFQYAIPFERPAKYAGKEFFTDEEIAALDKQRAAILRRDFRAKRGSEEDVAGAYNATFQSVRPTGRRTSQVVDPPDG